MLNEFILYFKTGFWHLINWKAILHILFILTILVAVDIKNWKRLLSLTTAFVVGHIISLGLSTYGVIHVKQSTINLLIPITILLMTVFNYVNGKAKDSSIQLILLGIFGIIHGLGFAYHLSAVLGKKQAVFIPLLSYNIGIEAAILILLIIASIAIYIISILARVNKNGVNGVLNALCMLTSAYYIYTFYY